jgi:hypothetical protein
MTSEWRRLAAVALDGARAMPVMPDEHGKRQSFVQMDPTLHVKNGKHFGTEFHPQEDQAPVVVVVPVSTPVSGEVDVHIYLDRLRMRFSTSDLKGLLNRDAAKNGL